MKIEEMDGRCDVVGLFEKDDVLKICAPMVRYSKLEFRSLVRKYGCQLCFTPMIMADSFISSEKARQNEFKTNAEDTPLVVQFAANSVNDFVQAAEMVSPYCGGVDLNCGCPQRWAMKAGYGSELLSHPQMVKDMIRQLRNRVPSNFSVSVKMRLKDNIEESVELCRELEAAGASFLTVHGRTPKQRNEPVNFKAIKDIVQSVRIPVVANGDIKNIWDVDHVHRTTGCQGVMCARGILQNPAMFACEPVTPVACVQDWVDTCIGSQTPFQCFHHHLVFMLEKVLPKAKRRRFNTLVTIPDVVDFLTDHLGIVRPDMTKLKDLHSEILYENTNADEGSYFRSKIEDKNNHVIEDFLQDSCLPLL